MPVRPFATLAGVLLVTVAAHAQPAPMEWGEVPEEHLAMTEYPADPDAQAVILGDYGFIEVRDNWEVDFERHRRIKLLSEAGYDLATVSLTYFAGRDGQRIGKIKGQTFVPEPGGGSRRIKMDKDAIFEEDLEGDRKRITFTLPALEPGAVVEFRYTISSKSPVQIPRWYFQEEEPVLWSEVRLHHPQDLAYTFITQSNPDFTVQTQEEGVRAGGKTNIYRWVATDVPALREERYMTTLEDYVQKIDIQLVEYYRRGVGVVNFLKTWEQVAEELDENTSFGRKLRVGGDVRRQAESLTAGLSTPAEKARAIYDHVRSTVAWDDSYRAFADRRLDEVLDVQRGSSAEINLLLVALLREAGLEAEPALASTRGHGRVIQQYPLVSQFNHVLAAVKLGGRWQLADATDPLRPMEILPVDVLGGEAWLVGDRSTWLPIEAVRSEHHVRIAADLLPDGTLTGTLHAERSGYAGLRARRKLQDDGAEGYATDYLLDDITGAEMGDVSITGQDEHDAPLVADVAFTVPGYAQTVGDLLLVNPLVTMRTGENPFKLARRAYPVDFAYPSASTYEAEITLPAGVEVDEVPRNALVLLPVRGGGYERTVEVEDGVLRVEAMAQIRRPVFEPHLYGDLKEYWDRSVAADEEVVVFKQASEAPAAEEAMEEEEMLEEEEVSEAEASVPEAGQSLGEGTDGDD